MRLLLMCILAFKTTTAISDKAENMQTFTESLYELHIYISSENKDELMRSVSKLEHANHGLKTYSTLLSVSESYLQYEQQISTYIPLLRRAIENSNFSQARMLTHQISDLCSACHASSKIKASKSFSKQNLPENVSLIQKASFLAATRQHEKALLEYEKVLDRLDAAHIEWEHALFESLNIIVRIKQSASLALELVSKLMDQKSSLSQQQVSMLAAWRADIKKWIHSKTIANFETNLSKEKLLAVLIEISQLEKQDLTKPEDILGLADLHIKLASYFPWARPHYYYQICIEKNPHTELAQTCWEKLKTHLKLTNELIDKYELLTRLSQQAQMKKAEP